MLNCCLGSLSVRDVGNPMDPMATLVSWSYNQVESDREFMAVFLTGRFVNPLNLFTVDNVTVWPYLATAWNALGNT